MTMVRLWIVSLAITPASHAPTVPSAQPVQPSVSEYTIPRLYIATANKHTMKFHRASSAFLAKLHVKPALMGLTVRPVLQLSIKLSMPVLEVTIAFVSILTILM